MAIKDKDKPSNVIPFRQSDAASAIETLLRLHSFGGLRNRAYNGQWHTFFGERGKRSVDATYRDVGDAMDRALDAASRTYAPELEKYDFTALVSEALLHLEQESGHIPSRLAKDYAAALAKLAPATEHSTLDPRPKRNLPKNPSLSHALGHVLTMVVLALEEFGPSDLQSLYLFGGGLFKNDVDGNPVYVRVPTDEDREAIVAIAFLKRLKKKADGDAP